MYDRCIQDLIDRFNITIKSSSELEGAGTYIPQLNLIVINSNMSEYEQSETLLHELGHACLHHDQFELYNATFATHSKYEYEANSFMINELVENYMSVNNLDADQVNYVNFIVDNKLNTAYIPVLKRILQTKSKQSSWSV